MKRDNIKVYVYPQFAAENICRDLNQQDNPKKKYAVISITDPGQPNASIDTGKAVRCIMRMRFYDVDSDFFFKNGRKIKAATHKDVVGLKAFIDEAVNDFGVDVILVHCAAGISRSAGCGAAIEEYLGIPDTIFNSTIYYPNRLVYRLCLEEFGMNKKEEEYSEIFNNLSE